MSFLGFTIAHNQIITEPNKVKAMVNWPTPSSRKQLQQFLGFANFYRCFINKYSVIALPLTRLTSPKTPFRWTEEAAAAFTELKNRFSSSPILSQVDPVLQCLVEVDASDSRVGAVLSQR
ncbi:uncharacterized protein KZ484_011443 [Pholidichthys leucotaenia]